MGLLDNNFPGMSSPDDSLKKYLSMLMSNSGGGLMKPPATANAGQQHPGGNMIPQPPPAQPNPYTQAMRGLAQPVVNSVSNQAGQDLYGAGKTGVKSAFDYFKGLGGPDTSASATSIASNLGGAGGSGLSAGEMAALDEWAQALAAGGAAI